jgi:hypothetical protein
MKRAQTQTQPSLGPEKILIIEVLGCFDIKNIIKGTESRDFCVTQFNAKFKTFYQGKALTRETTSLGILLIFTLHVIASS